MNGLFICLVALVAFATAPKANAQEFVVIVNVGNPVVELSKDAASKIFLKKQRKWDNGQAIIAVDLEKGSPVRDAFSRTVHGRPVTAIMAHWQQQIFSGKDVPPAERGSDSEALEMVRGNVNAVGYVAAGTTLGNGVKAVSVR